MEKKINIAELLKDCPKGTKLYSPLCGECRVINIYDRLGFDVICGDDTVYNFSYDGRYNIMGECCIFPSKENRDWSKFQRPFKDGDILSYQHKDFKNRTIYIYMQHRRMNTTYYVALSGNSNSEFMVNDKEGQALNSYNDSVRLATEEEKQKLFDAIKANGYRWNAETKTLEKLVQPKFKVGDRIKKDKDHICGIITNISDDGSYKVEYQEGGISYVSLAYQDEYELVPNKFDITTLKPFDKVLVRCSNDGSWEPQFFADYRPKSKFPFVCTYNSWTQCIPYEGNEHLSNTKNDCDEFYKTWE